MIQDIEIKKLKLLERNPRKITKEQMDKLIHSMETDSRFIHARPILVRADGDVLQVYAGNQRVRAAKKLKWKTIPCMVETSIELTDEIMRNRIILDNKSMGEWDDDILAADYAPDELYMLGFTAFELQIDAKNGDNDGQDDDEVPQENHPKPNESQIIEDPSNDDGTDDLISCPKCHHRFKS